MCDSHELRVDPSDGQARNFEECRELYEDSYSFDHICNYWEEQCQPLRSIADEPTSAFEEAKQLEEALARSAVEAEEEQKELLAMASAIDASLKEIGGAGLPTTDDSGNSTLPSETCTPIIMQWTWTDDHGGTQDFDIDANNMIESAYQIWKSGDGVETAIVRLRSGRFSYDIDFNHMMQRNVKTGKERRVYRSQDDEKALAEAIKVSLHAVHTSDCSLGVRDHHFDNDNFLQSPTVEYTLKVKFGSELRRLNAAWPASSKSEVVLTAIWDAIRGGFGESSLCPLPLLTYSDEDGDQCTLVEATVDDFLSFAKGGVLRLTLEAVAITVANEANTNMNLMLENAVDVSISTPQASPRKSEDEIYELDWAMVESSPATLDVEPTD